MSKVSKQRKEALAKFDKSKSYSLNEAVNIVKQITYSKFDASVDLNIRLGVDPRKANQMVRGSVTLPHGTGKVVRVLVLCNPDMLITLVWMNTSKRSRTVGPILTL